MKSIFILIGLLFASSALAATRYVDANLSSTCSGSTYSIENRNCSGSDGTGYKTLQEAADVTNAGDTVYIRAGTYGSIGASQDILNISRSGSSGSPITYQNYNGESVTIQGQEPGVNGGPDAVEIAANWIVFDGINVRGGASALWLNYATNVQVLNCDVRRGAGWGLGLYHSDNNVIRNCVVTDNARLNWPRGTAQTWGAGLTVQYGSSYNLVEDSAVYWNHGEGLSTATGAVGNTFRNNVVSDNYSVNLYNDGGQDMVFDRNLVYQTDAANNWICTIPPGAQACNYLGLGDPGRSTALGIGIAVEPDAAVDVTNMVVSNNISVNHHSNALGSAANLGAWLEPGQSYNLVNLKIYGNTFVRGRIYISPKTQQANGGIDGGDFANNIIINEGTASKTGEINYLFANNFTVRNNIWYGTNNFEYQFSEMNYAAWAASLSGTIFTNNIGVSTDPQLVNKSFIPCRLWDASDGNNSQPPGASCTPAQARAQADNYKLQQLSPAKDSGLALGAPYNHDYANITRPVDYGFDMGAFEYGTGVPPPPPGTQLVLALGMDAGTGNTVQDSSGFNNNGTFGPGVSWDNTGKYGKALSFNGTGSVTIPNANSLNPNAITVEAWIYPTTNPGTMIAAVTKNYSYYLYSTTSPGTCGTQDVALAGYESGTGNHLVCDIQALPLNTWTHLAMVNDQTSVFMYRDGILVSSIYSPLGLIASNGTLQIGASQYGENFIGKIDEVRIYNYARTQSEIQNDMNTPLTPAAPGAIIKISPATSLKLSATNGALKVGQ